MFARIALATMLLSAATAASAQNGARERGTVLMSEDAQYAAFQAQAGFSDAVITEEGTIYLSGVVAIVGADETEIEPAFVRAYEQAGRTLERAGASWADVVDVQSFHTDLTTQINVMSAVQQRYITAPFPAWTAIQVSRLYPDRGIAEIKFIAQLPTTISRCG